MLTMKKVGTTEAAPPVVRTAISVAEESLHPLPCRAFTFQELAVLAELFGGSAKGKEFAHLAVGPKLK